jgi:alpha/beta superfamily hydrolase
MTGRPPAAQRVSVAGPAGAIEVIVEQPAQAPQGIALIGHPHPLFGGTAENKVVQTVARSLRDLGYVALRPYFRGVGGSEGVHDEGRGETEDMLAVLDYARARFDELPVVLGGFSFGAYVQTRVAKRLADAGRPAQRLVLIGTAAGHVEGLRRYATEAVPANTVVIHGALDETVPLENVLAWAQPLDLPVVVVPGADHFFHRKLHILRHIIAQAWCR